MQETQTRASTAGRTRTIIIATVALVVVVGVLAWRFVPAFGPLGMAQGYCADVMAQRYDAVYTQRFSSETRAQISQASFVLAEQLADSQVGRVTACDVSLLDVTVSGSTAKAAVDVVRAAKDIAVTLQMVSSDWRITTLPDPAIAPFGVAQAFCDAVGGQHYSDAYHLFAPNITQSLQADRYTQISQLSDQGNGTITKCTISQMTIDTAGKSATAQATEIRSQGNADGTTFEIALGKQADGSWMITAIPNI